jgi:signal peptidase II
MSDERDQAETEAPSSEREDPSPEEASESGSSESGSSGAASDESPSKAARKREDDAPKLSVPPAKPLSGPPPSYAFLAVTALLALAADLGTKAWAVSRLGDTHVDRIVVVENFFNLDLAHNKGGAWGIFGDQPDYVRLPFFFLISAVAVVFVVSLYKRLEPRQTALKWALPLLLGGAAGNLIDRIRHQYVVDFLDVYIVQGGKQTHWPTFNVADVWIVVGVGLMAIDMFTPRKPVPAKASTKPSSEAEAEA